MENGLRFTPRCIIHKVKHCSWSMRNSYPLSLFMKDDYQWKIFWLLISTSNFKYVYWNKLVHCDIQNINTFSSHNLTFNKHPAETSLNVTQFWNFHRTCYGILQLVCWQKWLNPNVSNNPFKKLCIKLKRTVYLTPPPKK